MRPKTTTAQNIRIALAFSLFYTDSFYKDFEDIADNPIGYIKRMKSIGPRETAFQRRLKFLLGGSVKSAILFVPVRSNADDPDMMISLERDMVSGWLNPVAVQEVSFSEGAGAVLQWPIHFEPKLLLNMCKGNDFVDLLTLHIVGGNLHSLIEACSDLDTQHYLTVYWKALRDVYRTKRDDSLDVYNGHRRGRITLTPDTTQMPMTFSYANTRTGSRLPERFISLISDARFHIYDGYRAPSQFMFALHHPQFVPWVQGYQKGWVEPLTDLLRPGITGIAGVARQSTGHGELFIEHYDNDAQSIQLFHHRNIRKKLGSYPLISRIDKHLFEPNDNLLDLLKRQISESPFLCPYIDRFIQKHCRHRPDLSTIEWFSYKDRPLSRAEVRTFEENL